MHHKYHYQSLTDFGAVLATAEPDPRYRCDSEDRTDWAGATMAGAIATARAGGASHDASGLERLQQARHRLNENIQSTGNPIRVEAAMVGAMPSVPRALSGSPKAMLRMRKKQAPGPVVRIGFGVGYSGITHTRAITARAAAILAIVDQLERKGRRVELVARYCNEMGGNGKLTCDITIKRPGDYYTPQALAFTLAPEFLRRLGFLFTDHVANTTTAKHPGSNYGKVVDYDTDEFDYYAPSLLGDEHPRSAERAYNKLKEQWGLA